MERNIENNKKVNPPRPDIQAAPGPIGTPGAPEVLPAPSHSEAEKESLDIAKFIENREHLTPTEGTELIKAAIKRGELIDTTPPTSSEDYSS